MSVVGQGLVLLIALLHLGIMAIEMVLWDKPAGIAIFRTTPEFAASTRALAANQGLYNGFLAAGLLWGVWLTAASPAGFGHAIETFFLACVLVAGLFGAITASRRILYIQTIPALVALIVLWAAG